MQIEEIQSQLQPLQNDVVSMKKVAEALVIKTDEDLVVALDSASAVNDKAKEIDKQRKFFVDPLNKQVKNINDIFKPRILEAEEVVAILKNKMGAYKNEQDAKAAAEQKRLDDIRAAADAKRAESGKEAIAAPVRQVEAPAKTVVTNENKTVMRKVWKHQIESIDALPADVKKAIMAEAYRKGLIDTVIRQFIKAGIREMGGVRIYEDTEIALGKN